MLSWHRQGGDKHGDAAQHKHRPHEAAHAPQKDGPTNHENITVNLGYKLSDTLFISDGTISEVSTIHCCESQDSTCVYAAAEPAARCYRGSLHMLLP